jgi:hypothetical protein
VEFSIANFSAYYGGTREAEVTFVLAILLLLKSNMNSTKQIYITKYNILYIGQEDQS